MANTAKPAIPIAIQAIVMMLRKGTSSKTECKGAGIIENRLVRNDTRGVIDRGGLLYDSYQASLTHCRGRENSKRLLLLAQVGKERDCNREA